MPGSIALSCGLQHRRAEAHMRILITWGSERGGTEGIAHMLAEKLRRDGIVVETVAADRATRRSRSRTTTSLHA
jgi:hypothetical protein